MGRGSSPLAHAAHRSRSNLRPRTPHRCRDDHSHRLLGNQPRYGHLYLRQGPLSRRRANRSRQEILRSRPRIHGLTTRHPHRRDQDRCSLPRLLHQRPHRRSPRRCSRRQRPSHRHHRARYGRPWLTGGQASGRTRGPRRHLQNRRLRVARTWLQHVPRHEPRHPRTRRTLRLYQQPQLRRPSGPRWAHTSRQP